MTSQRSQFKQAVARAQWNWTLELVAGKFPLCCAYVLESAKGSCSTDRESLSKTISFRVFEVSKASRTLRMRIEAFEDKGISAPPMGWTVSFPYSPCISELPLTCVTSQALQCSKFAITRNLASLGIFAGSRRHCSKTLPFQPMDKELKMYLSLDTIFHESHVLK